MKYEHLERMEVITNLKVEETPTYVTVKALSKKLSDYFEEDKVNIFLKNITINVDETFIEDEEVFEKTIDAYITLFVNIDEVCTKDGISTEVVLETTSIELLYYV